jgi:hypothetical protein
MKKLLFYSTGITIVLILVGISTKNAFAAIGSTPVQQTTCSATSGGSLSCVLGSLPTAGNFLVLSYANTGQTPTVVSVAGDGTWASSTQANGNGTADDETWYDMNATAATTTIALTLSGNTGATARVNVSEWSGVATSSALDVAATSTSPTTSNVSTSNINPIAGLNELIFADFKGPSITSGPTQGFTALATTSAASGAGYLVVANTSGQYFTTWNGGSSQYNTGISAFKAASSSGGGGGAAPLISHTTILTMDW